MRKYIVRFKSDYLRATEAEATHKITARNDKSAASQAAQIMRGLVLNGFLPQHMELHEEILNQEFKVFMV